MSDQGAEIERRHEKCRDFQHAYVRFTVSSPPLVRTVLPSTEKTIEPVSTPLACAPSIVILGRTKFELACHICMAPSKHAEQTKVERDHGNELVNEKKVRRKKDH